MKTTLCSFPSRDQLPVYSQDSSYKLTMKQLATIAQRSRSLFSSKQWSKGVWNTQNCTCNCKRKSLQAEQCEKPQPAQRHFRSWLPYTSVLLWCKAKGNILGYFLGHQFYLLLDTRDSNPVAKTRGLAKKTPWCEKKSCCKHRCPWSCHQPLEVCRVRQEYRNQVADALK